MTLDRSHLEYPLRRRGMDHDRYQWSMLVDRPPIAWPNGAPLAVWINVSLQHFPLDQRGEPFPPPGGLTMPYPDLRHYTLRDYGNRVGIFRVLEALSRHQATASFAVNGELAERYPSLLRRVAETGEVLAHGWNMDCPHFGGMGEDNEKELIDRTAKALRRASGQEVRGWLGPGRNESENTPELLKQAGFSFLCDWVNDDLPYMFTTKQGALTALPLSTELEDRFILQNNLHSEESWVEQICDACDFLYEEAEREGGRLLALSIHPWLIGQPHRIRSFESVLQHIMSKPAIWSAAPGEIVEHWLAQQ
ncbi:MAG: polysaccharide deacetylase family protein [Pseudomonadota bacterium]